MRPWVVGLLCTLLLSLQQQGYVHPFKHLRLDGPRETIVSNAHAAVDCLECTLLAGGFDATDAPPQLLAAHVPSGLVFFPYHSRAEVPAWFQSRAPPLLL